MGYDTVDANLMVGHKADEREYTAAALILKDLGVLSVRMLTNNPMKIESLQALGIPISARVPLSPHITAENATYLRTKVQRMRHLLHLGPTVGTMGDRLQSLRLYQRGPRRITDARGDHLSPSPMPRAWMGASPLTQASRCP